MLGLYWTGWFLTVAWCLARPYMPGEALLSRLLTFGFVALFWPFIVGMWFASYLLRWTMRRRSFVA